MSVFKFRPKGWCKFPLPLWYSVREARKLPLWIRITKSNFHKVTIARDNGNTVEIGSGVSSQATRLSLNISSQIAEGETVEVHESREGSANAPAQKQ